MIRHPTTTQQKSKEDKEKTLIYHGGKDKEIEQSIDL